MIELDYHTGVAPLPPEEAIAYLRGLTPLTEEAWRALEDLYGKAAFTIAGVEQQYLIEAAQEAIAVGLEEGLTNREIGKLIDAAFEQAGVGSLNKYHLETVVENNINTALAAGHEQAGLDPDVLEEFPDWRLVTAGDGRVRASHARLNGMQAPKGDPVWNQASPPLGHRCRCRKISVKSGPRIDPGPPYADPGWGRSPSQALLELAGG